MGKRILQFFIVILLLLSGLIIYSYIQSQKEQPIYCSYDGSFVQYLSEDSPNTDVGSTEKVEYVDSSTLNAPENLLVIVGEDGMEHYYRVEIASTPEEQALGLMYRKRLDKNSGMLFIFEEAKPTTFWMKNTYVPLDMIFIGEDGKVVDIHENAEPLSEDYIHSPNAVKAVLELNAGDVKRLGIKIGTRIYHDIFDEDEEGDANLDAR